MKKAIVAFGFVLGLSGISNTQAQMRIYIATAGGKLTGESKKITLDGGARINSGSVVNLTANEFDFQSGFTIESGSNVVFQVK